MRDEGDGKPEGLRLGVPVRSAPTIEFLQEHLPGPRRGVQVFLPRYPLDAGLVLWAEANLEERRLGFHRAFAWAGVRRVTS